MKSYGIDRDPDSWVLRLFGRQDAMISGPTLESAKEQLRATIRDASYWVIGHQV